MVQKIHPRGVIWVPRIRPGFDDSNLASALRVRSIKFSSPWYIVCSKYLHTLKICYDCDFFSIWKNTGLLQWQKIFSPLSKIHNYFNDNLELCCSSFWQSKYYSITRRHFHKSNTLEPKLLRWDINIFTLQIHKMFSCSSIMKRLKNYFVKSLLP